MVADLSLRLPQPVQVAVLPGRNLLGLEFKCRLRGLSRVEKFPVCLAVGDDLDPLDVVCLLYTSPSPRD